MRLLLAEDEADLAEALGVFFEKNHFSVDIVHDGRTACEYAESSVYDVIILDVMMPYMDGFTALRRMRADGNKTPIMMLTARGEERDETALRDSIPARMITSRSRSTRTNCSSAFGRCFAGAILTGLASCPSEI